MSVRAEGARHLATLWKGEKPWHWLALKYGRVQPRGYRTYRRSRFLWQVHITPLHIARDNAASEFGLCFGDRTVYLLRHR